MRRDNGHYRHRLGTPPSDRPPTTTSVTLACRLLHRCEINHCSNPRPAPATTTDSSDFRYCTVQAPPWRPTQPLEFSPRQETCPVFAARLPVCRHFVHDACLQLRRVDTRMTSRSHRIIPLIPSSLLLTGTSQRVSLQFALVLLGWMWSCVEGLRVDCVVIVHIICMICHFMCIQPLVTY